VGRLCHFERIRRLALGGCVSFWGFGVWEVGMRRGGRKEGRKDGWVGVGECRCLLFCWGGRMGL